MIRIGESCEAIKKLQSKLKKYEQRLATLNEQIAETENAICELEKSKLPIKVLLAIEDWRCPQAKFWTSSDTHWNNIYYFPDIDMIYKKQDYSWGKKPLYPNEIDLSKFYSSGCDTIETQLSYEENFMRDEKFKPVIESAISDVKSRIEFILKKNDDIDNWELIGKLLIASYYNQ